MKKNQQAEKLSLAQFSRDEDVAKNAATELGKATKARKLAWENYKLAVNNPENSELSSEQTWELYEQATHVWKKAKAKAKAKWKGAIKDLAYLAHVEVRDMAEDRS